MSAGDGWEASGDRGLDRFNRLAADEVEPLLRRCLAASRWARGLADGRPFADAERLYATADLLAAGLADSEVRAALAEHPRIGERPPPAAGTAALSAAEQSGVDPDDRALTDGLRAANLAYEARFGHRYLVCARGRDGHDLLADARERLRNDPAVERAVVRRELGAIARLRLAAIIEQLAASGSAP